MHHGAQRPGERPIGDGVAEALQHRSEQHAGPLRDEVQPQVVPAAARVRVGRSERHVDDAVAERVTTEGCAGEVAFVTNGTTQLHLAERDLGAGFRTGNAIKPLERGHIAFRTDNIEGFKRRLMDKGIPFSDYGASAMGGWEQVFFHDPVGNVVEVHQDRSSKSA